MKTILDLLKEKESLIETNETDFREIQYHQEQGVSQTLEIKQLKVEERLELQLLLKKIEVKKTMLSNLQITIENKNLILQNLALRSQQLKTEIGSLTTQINLNKEDAQLLSQDYEMLVLKLKEKYNLGNDWEFDDDTGIIKEIDNAQ